MLIVYVFFVVATIPLIIGAMIHLYARAIGNGNFHLYTSMVLLAYMFS
ncbi:hypothetical protein [Coxiella-like endosymbiont]|nr:hypothetical protein [Coxiella-like endosymbiont]